MTPREGGCSAQRLGTDPQTRDSSRKTPGSGTRTSGRPILPAPVESVQPGVGTWDPACWNWALDPFNQRDCLWGAQVHGSTGPENCCLVSLRDEHDWTTAEAGQGNGDNREDDTAQPPQPLKHPRQGAVVIRGDKYGSIRFWQKRLALCGGH